MEQVASEVLDAVKVKMENQGDYSHEAYKAFVDEAIDDFVRSGVITDDDNTEMIADKMMLSYKDVVDSMARD